MFVFYMLRKVIARNSELEKNVYSGLDAEALQTVSKSQAMVRCCGHIQQGKRFDRALGILKELRE